MKKSSLTYRFPFDFNSIDREKVEKLKEGIPSKRLYKIEHLWCEKSPESHKGWQKSAVDFLVLDGTIVVAAQDGVVANFRDTLETYGNSKFFADLANFICLWHDISPRKAEFSSYVHLRKGSVSSFGLKEGDKVKQGQPIAVVGKTGWTDKDHLHFQIFYVDFWNENVIDESTL